MLGVLLLLYSLNNLPTCLKIFLNKCRDYKSSKPFDNFSSGTMKQLPAVSS